MRQQMVMSFLLLMGVAGTWAVALGQEPKVSTPVSGIPSFLAADLPEFNIQDLDLEAAVEKLRTTVAQRHATTVPEVGVIRYDGAPATDANPWQMRESICLTLEKCSAADVLHCLAEATGFVTLTDKWRIGLFEVPNFKGAATEDLSPNTRNALSVREFAELKLPVFQCKGMHLDEAVQFLRKAATKVSGKSAPPVVIMRYHKPGEPSSRSSSRRHPTNINLDLQDESAGDCLRYIAELSGFSTKFHTTCATVCEIPMLYHPKIVKQYDLDGLIKVWGKPDKPVDEWLMDKLMDHDIPVVDMIGVNERTRQVFIACPPEYVGAILRGPTKKAQRAKEPREAKQEAPSR